MESAILLITVYKELLEKKAFVVTEGYKVVELQLFTKVMTDLSLSQKKYLAIPYIKIGQWNSTNILKFM